MSGAEITAYIVGIGTLLGGLAALLQARYEGRKKNIEGHTIGETALANAVQVVEEVYDKVTGRMNKQIDELLGDNQKLREDVGLLRKEVATLTASEEACREEVRLLREEVKSYRAGDDV